MSATRRPKRPDQVPRKTDAAEIHAVIDKLSPELKKAVTRFVQIWRSAGYQTLGPRGRKIWKEVLPGSALFGFRPERPSARVEANALIANCIRNGPLENLHASGEPLDQAGMRELMIFSSRQLEGCLEIRNLLLSEEPGLWWSFINSYHSMYCSRWSVA